MSENKNWHAVTTRVPLPALATYLHSQDAWLSCIKRLHFDDFQVVEIGTGARRSLFSGKVFSPIGTFEIEGNVESHLSGDELKFSGRGKLAKLSSFGLNGKAILNSDDVVHVGLQPVMDGLPPVIRQLVSLGEKEIVSRLTERIDNYYQAQV